MNMNTMTETTKLNITNEADLFDALAKLGISKVEFRYKDAGCDGGTAFDEAGNEVERFYAGVWMDSEIYEAAWRFAEYRVEHMEWGDHENSTDDWATVTFDVKARYVSLEGESAYEVTETYPVEIALIWWPDVSPHHCAKLIDE
jgi:hypothetical protein